jgi:hypothetical protein
MARASPQRCTCASARRIARALTWRSDEGGDGDDPDEDEDDEDDDPMGIAPFLCEW